MSGWSVNLPHSGFSLGILKHASGTPCLAQFGVPECKICVQVSEYDESSWSYETRAAPIATSDLRYVMHFPSLQNGPINLFISLRLIVFEQYFVYHSICLNCLRFLRSKAEFFVPSTLVAAMFRKSGMLDRSK